MSMKRRSEHSVLSVSLFSRTLLVVGAVGLATACARHDANRSDSAGASADTTVTTSATSATSATPTPAVESVSTGETTVASHPEPTPAPAAAPAPSTKAKPAPTTHHTAKPHADSTATPAAATVASAAPKADTGNTAAKSDTGAGEDHLLVTPEVYEGWKMFAVYCYRCHGVDAMGGGIAPNLRHSVSSEGSVTHDVFVTTVTNGRVEKGMPTWKALLSPEQIEDLWQYVTSRSSGKLAPGRPHMAGGKNP